ncbi:histidine kinase [Paenibacillus sp. P26]|nr:histidine kinase [Paenibacillus sp. P26]
MEGHDKRLTNMIWRSMAESIGLSLVLFGVIFYFLHYNGYIVPFTSWSEGIMLSLSLIAVVVAIGGTYGLWTSSRMKHRLEQIREVMLSLEKGNLSRSVPPLGEDEIGRLGEQLNAITKKWEEQVSSLQRLSSNNARLAQKAKYSAIVEERQRLARELHDAVSQRLFAISMTATAVGRTLDKDFEKARRGKFFSSRRWRRWPSRRCARCCCICGRCISRASRWRKGSSSCFMS